LPWDDGYQKARSNLMISSVLNLQNQKTTVEFKMLDTIPKVKTFMNEALGSDEELEQTALTKENGSISQAFHTHYLKCGLLLERLATLKGIFL